MSKKVCVLTTVHKPSDIRVFIKQIMSLAKAGYQVDFIVKEGNIYCEHDNVNYHFFERQQGMLNRIKNVFVVLKKAIRLDDDIYHFHDPELMFAGLILKIFYRKKVIYDIHELNADAIRHKPYLTKPWGSIFAFIYTFIERLIINFFDMNILAEVGYQKYYRDKKHLILQNFVPISFTIKELANFNDLTKEINFIYLGGLSRVRGVYEIFELAAKLSKYKKIKIHLIGKFQPVSIKEDLEKKISENQLEDVFEIYGGVPFPEALYILRKCDIGLLPLHPILNHTTILSTKLYEYMGNGLVPMTSDYPLLKNFLEKHNCGLVVDFFNLDKEINRIVAFLDNIDQVNDMKRRNIETVRQNYTWEIEEKKILALYDELSKDTVLIEED
jgi:glycosyltransferase involved in cell wall biosynthesis